VEFSYPPSVELACRPTPLVPLPRLSRRLGCTLLCKRDDLTGAVLSGNKVRKLEFLLAEALARGFNGVITCGGEQSNHARATAVAATRLGLTSHLVLRTPDPSSPPTLEGNILLDRLVGATIHWIAPEDYPQRNAIMESEAARLARTQDRSMYQVPEGGSNALGAWGYVRCAAELLQQLGRQQATVVCAVGSGGTMAGLLAGCRMLDLPYRLVGVCVCDDRPFFQQRISEILDQMAEDYSVDVRLAPEQVEIWDGYVGLGYALSRAEELCCIRDFARQEGLVTDPVYTGKALHGLITELQQGARLPQPVVFLHTGGVYGLFAKANELVPLL